MVGYDLETVEAGLYVSQRQAEAELLRHDTVLADYENDTQFRAEWEAFHGQAAVFDGRYNGAALLHWLGY